MCCLTFDTHLLVISRIHVYIFPSISSSFFSFLAYFHHLTLSPLLFRTPSHVLLFFSFHPISSLLFLLTFLLSTSCTFSPPLFYTLSLTHYTSPLLSTSLHSLSPPLFSPFFHRHSFPFRSILFPLEPILQRWLSKLVTNSF